jgi:competence protein ComEC
MRLLQRLRVTALDVGQGDATLVDLPDGRLMLIDGGGFVGVPIDPGERVLVPTLRARRRERIDVLVLTHPHPDHYGGLASVVRQVDIGEFWYGGEDVGARADTAAAPAADTPAAAPRGSYAELLQLLQLRGVRMRSAAQLCADAEPVDAAIRLLHPCPSASSAPSANDASLVLRIRHGRHVALLVGDAEHWAEQRLLSSSAAALDADFLKVGHHGSRTSSSSAFLARVTPRIATISCGIRNRFGHPHAEALAHLEAAGARVVRLDQTGAVVWQSDGDTAAVDTFAPAPTPR